LDRWQVHYRRDEAVRVAAPSLTTRNGTAPIGADRAVVAAHDKAAASGKNISKCISTVGAELQHASIETDVGIDLRRFQIEVVLEC
jgi:hypothetical protein